MCRDFIDVETGEVRVSSEPAILRAIAVGSCVVVTAYDRYKKLGGLAHVMLPGRSPGERYEDKTKYAEDALDILFGAVKKAGAKTERLEVCLIGGANILGEGDISEKVAESVIGYLNKLEIKIKGKRLGGAQRRAVYLDVASGKISYSEGGGPVTGLEGT